MNNTSTIALIAIVAIAGLLIAATAFGPTQAFAHKHHKHHNSVSQDSRASIRQSNVQTSVNVGGGSSSQSATNSNSGSATATNVIS